MKIEHTPGKWKAHGEFIGTDEDDTQTIAYLSCHRNRAWRSQVETNANARLIENAPDLLKALVALLEKISDSSVDDWTDYINNNDAKIEEIENAYQLIGKITDKEIQTPGKLSDAELQRTVQSR